MSNLGNSASGFKGDNSSFMEPRTSFVMSSPNYKPHLLPDLRRIVTTHDAQGIAVVQSDTVLPSEVSQFLYLAWICTNSMKKMELVEGARSSGIWVTKDALPTNDNNSM